MAAANESQGLKIAVAAFVSLSVILAVTSYFMYSNYSQQLVKADDAESKAKEALKTSTEALRATKNVLEKVGGPELAKRDTVDAVNKAISDETKKWQQKLADRSAELTKAPDRSPRPDPAGRGGREGPGAGPAGPGGRDQRAAGDV